METGTLRETEMKNYIAQKTEVQDAQWPEIPDTCNRRALWHRDKRFSTENTNAHVISSDEEVVMEDEY